MNRAAFMVVPVIMRRWFDGLRWSKEAAIFLLMLTLINKNEKGNRFMADFGKISY